LLIAVAFNWVFAWRRYPAALAVHKHARGQLSRDDWAYALGQIESLADVSEDELVELHTIALQHARERRSPVSVSRRQSEQLAAATN